MNTGYLKNNDGEGSKYVTIKTNPRFFKHSRVYSTLLKLANVGDFTGVESLRTAYSWNRESECRVNVNLFSFGCHVIDRAYVRTRLQIVRVG